MKKYLTIGAVSLIGAGLLAAGVFAEAPASPHDVGSTLEVHIGDNGKVLVRGAQITGISGNTITAETKWGSIVLTWNVVVGDTTELVRRFGGTATLAEFSTGDFISFTGSLDTAASAFTVHAKVVKDWSVQIARTNFSGTVKSVGSSSFVLTTSHGDITVSVSSGTRILRGDNTISLSDIVVGNRVSHTSGLFDNVSKTLNADTVRIFVNENLLNRRNFQGTLKSISSTSLPTTFVFSVGSKDYTVNVPAGISIVNRNYGTVSLSQFRVGDAVRIFGAVEASNETTIDATVVRDVNI